MVTINDLSPKELQYLRSKWDAEKAELELQMTKRRDRLEHRLDLQEEDAELLAQKERQLAHAQAVLDFAAGTNADESLLTAQQAVVDALAWEVASYGLRPGYVSNTDALRIQAELARLEFEMNYRTAMIAEIDVLLAGG